MSCWISGFEHQAAEDRAAVALGLSYWSRTWHECRERASDRSRSPERRAEALRCLNVAAYWLARMQEGGPH